MAPGAKTGLIDVVVKHQRSRTHILRRRKARQREMSRLLAEQQAGRHMYSYIASLHEQEGDLAGAVAAARQGWSAAPGLQIFERAAVALLLARLYAKLRSPDRSGAWAERAAALVSPNPEANVRLGDALLNAGKTGLAMLAWRRSTTEGAPDPRMPSTSAAWTWWPRVRMAGVAAREGDLELAHHLITEATEWSMPRHALDCVFGASNDPDLFAASMLGVEP